MSISEELNKIKNAIYGREVRDAIHDGIKKTYDDASQGGNTNMEVSLARGGFQTLNERLTNVDGILNSVSQQLAHKADQVDVDRIDDNKADKAALSLGLNSKRDKDVEIGMADLDQETREAFTGGSVAVVGEDSVGEINLKDSSVTSSKLHKNAGIKFPYFSDETFDLDYFWEAKTVIVSGSVKNNPVGTGCQVTNLRGKTTNSHAGAYITQIAVVYGSGTEYDFGYGLYRHLRVNETTVEVLQKGKWKKLGISEDFMVGEYLSDDTYDLDTIVEQGNYMVNANVRNNPLPVSGLLSVDKFMIPGNNLVFGVRQKITGYGTGVDNKYLGKALSRSFSFNADNGEIARDSGWADDSIDDTKTIKILTIGNSFGLDTTRYIHHIAQSAGVNVITASLYISGGLLSDHDENITNSNNPYRIYNRNYTDGTITDNFVENQTVDDALDMHDWDYVFFNQASSQSGVYDTFQPYLNNIIDYVKGKQPNAKIALMPTWAYSSDFDDTRFDKYNRDQLTMYNEILDTYKNAMSDVPFDKIIPAGTAIQNARTDGYMMGIERELTRDGYHLSDTGCFIAGVTFFKSLIDKNAAIEFVPSTVDKRAVYFGKIAAENAVINPFKITEI